MPDPWPLRHLVLRTPRLTLRPDDDAGLYELAALALCGVHPPEEMPFLTAWTAQSPDDLVRSSVQHFWRTCAQLTARFVRPDWTLQVDGLDGCRQTLGVL